MPSLASRIRARSWALLLTVIAVLSVAGCASAPAGSSGASLPAGATEPAAGSLAAGVAAPVATTARPSNAPTSSATAPRGTAASTSAPEASAASRLASVQITLQPLAAKFDRPLYVTHAADGSGRLFVVGKGGQIWIVQDGQARPAPFLDIGARVGSNGSEQGLLGLAFPPDFGQRRFFFVDYTDKNGDTVVSRFNLTQDPNRADPASEFRVLGVDQPAANHNGGMLAFGRDGYLYVGLGDGGGAGDTYHNGQNPASLLAKILRLDVTGDPSQPYRVPADNPWVNQDWAGQKMRPEAWLIGLRNPWRFSFDRATGDLWVADVGQNQYEEVNFDQDDRSGLNFGWPIMEGLHCYSAANCATDGLVFPAREYTHAEGGCSITGGYVYRGQQFPALSGIYLYGDYCSGKLWGLAGDGQGGWQNRLLLESNLRLSSFGEDEAGEVYVTDIGGGQLYHIEAR
jgi:glucose/arabinose dehydrogenase